MKITTDELTKIKQALTSIRTENSSQDVWNKFVIPRFYQEAEFKPNHPLRIEGKRGCGKTILLKFLSYQSQFSKCRENIPEDAIKNVGLYLKADTQFLRTLQKRSISEDEWILIFDHYLSIKLAIELLKSLRVIAESAFNGFSEDSYNAISFPNIKGFDFKSTNADDLLNEFKNSLITTEMAIINIRNLESLNKLPSTFLDHLIKSIKEIISDLNIRVFIDEYENLLPYQQHVINTKIKSSNESLRFNIATKKNGMSDFKTLSSESLETPADYSIYNLDEKIEKNKLDIYLGEIFLKKLIDASDTLRDELDFNIDLLTDPTQLFHRKEKEYIKSVNDFVTSILPNRTNEDLAEEVFLNSTFFKKLQREIAHSIKNHTSLTKEDFIDENHKKASIVCSSLLNRNTLSAEEVKKEFDLLRNENNNKFTGRTEWINNNFIGSYLRIISTYSNNSTYYSGFNVLCSLSSGNVRHFLELARTSLGLMKSSDSMDSFIVDNNTQDLASRKTSQTLVNEVKQFTPKGFQLLKLVEGLGSLFYECQLISSQSEPEINHFGFSNAEQLTDDDQVIISEAEKWGILQVRTSTKDKNKFGNSINEYILNPIFSPRFGISYRKGRKKNITVEEFRKLYTNGKSAVENILIIEQTQISLQGSLL